MDINPPSSRQARKISERRDQILKSAALLFATKGFHRTTTREIAQAADVSEGTLYNYFESKNDLLLGIVTELAKTQQAGATLGTPVDNDVQQFITTILLNPGIYTEQNQAMLQAVLSEILADACLRERYLHQVVEPATQLIEKQIKTLIGRGLIRQIDESSTAHFIMAIWIGMFVLRTIGDPGILSNWEKLTEVISSIVLNGFSFQS